MSEQCVILNDIHIDIMDYIKPAYCTEAQVCPACNSAETHVAYSLPSSVACGPNSSGRIGSTSQPRHRMCSFI